MSVSGSSFMGSVRRRGYAGSGLTTTRHNPAAVPCSGVVAAVNGFVSATVTAASTVAIASVLAVVTLLLIRQRLTLELAILPCQVDALQPRELLVRRPDAKPESKPNTGTQTSE